MIDSIFIKIKETIASKYEESAQDLIIYTAIK